MADSDKNKITIEFSLREVEVLSNALRGYSPAMDDEMIAVILYARIIKKIRDLQK